MVSGDPPNTSPKPTGKKTKKLSQKEQSRRFAETARELGVGESSAEFERVINKILDKPQGM